MFGIPDDAAVWLDLGRPVLFMSLMGILAALIVGLVGYAQTRAAVARLEAVHQALDLIEEDPLPDPEVDAITGELEIVQVCPHLSRIDRLDGLTCSECTG
jgi:hypothetical protein